MKPKNETRQRRRNPEIALKQILENPAYWKKFDAELKQLEGERQATRKDAILHLRVNSRDLARLKEKASSAGMKYQSFIAEILHRAAQS